MDKTLGQRIRELREERDISLREFARRLDGLSAAHVSDIELGRRFPSADVLLKMAHVLHVDVAELKKLDSRPPVEELRRRAEADPSYGIALRRMVGLAGDGNVGDVDIGLIAFDAFAGSFFIVVVADEAFGQRLPDLVTKDVSDVKILQEVAFLLLDDGHGRFSGTPWVAESARMMAAAAPRHEVPG